MNKLDFDTQQAANFFELGRRSGLKEGLEWVLNNFENSLEQSELFLVTLRAEGTYVSTKQVDFYRAARDELRQMLRIMEMNMKKQDE